MNEFLPLTEDPEACSECMKDQTSVRAVLAKQNDLRALSYDELVERYEDYLEDTPYVWIRRDTGESHVLLVTFATHKGGLKYAALETVVKSMPFDVLCLRDPENSYYLGSDLGAGYARVLSHVLSKYKPENTLMFGSSMAGYAALRWGLEFNTNCVVNNPQLNLDISAKLSWRELQENIMRIPKRMNLEDLNFSERSCAITCLHSRHPMDRANIEVLLKMWLRIPGMSLFIQQHPEENHRYLIRTFAEFDRLVRLTLQARAEGSRFQMPF